MGQQCCGPRDDKDKEKKEDDKNIKIEVGKLGDQIKGATDSLATKGKDLIDKGAAAAKSTGDQIKKEADNLAQKTQTQRDEISRKAQEITAQAVLSTGKAVQQGKELVDDTVKKVAETGKEVVGKIEEVGKDAQAKVEELGKDAQTKAQQIKKEVSDALEGKNQKLEGSASIIDKNKEEFADANQKA